MVNKVWDLSIKDLYLRAEIAKDDDLGFLSLVCSANPRWLRTSSDIRRQTQKRRREVTQGRGHSGSVGHRSSHQSHSAQLRVSHGVASGEWRCDKSERQSSMTSTAETLDQIQVFWSILLLPATIILNVTAFLMLLKSAGSCLKDPIVSPLLSVIG